MFLSFTVTLLVLRSWRERLGHTPSSIAKKFVPTAVATSFKGRRRFILGGVFAAATGLTGPRRGERDEFEERVAPAATHFADPGDVTSTDKLGQTSAPVDEAFVLGGANEARESTAAVCWAIGGKMEKDAWSGGTSVRLTCCLTHRRACIRFFVKNARHCTFTRAQIPGV